MSYYRTKAADVGHDIFVSDFTHCDEAGAAYDRVIHIWRESQGAHRCRQVLGGKPTGLAINWTELQSYRRMSVTVLPTLADFVRPAGRVLIHCQAGLARAPSVALLAKVIRGSDPWAALADIHRANYTQRAVTWGVWIDAINEAVDFWHRYFRR